MAEEETPQTTGASKKRKIMQMSEQDIQNLVYNSEAVNTKKQTALAMKMFRDYLMEKELDPDFEKYDAQTLDESLTKFYAEIRNKKGEMYKKPHCRLIVRVFRDICNPYGRTISIL